MILFKNESKVKNEIERLSRITKITSYIRLALSLNLVVWIVCLLSLEDYIIYGILSIVSFILMLSFIFITNKYYNELSLNRRKELVYNSHHKRRELKLSSFLDEGRDYLNKDDYKLSDLDIFGSNSLYQYLNVCKTKPGRRALANQLTYPVHKDIEFTKCVKALAENENTLELEAKMLEFDASAKNVDYDEFNSVNQKIKLKALFLVPVIFFVLTITYLILIFTINLNPYPIIALVLINFFSCRICLQNDIFNLDSAKYFKLCEAYFNLSKKIVDLDFNDDYYNKLKNIIHTRLDDLNKMKSIYLSLSTRKNAIANLLFNSLFVYDFWLIIIYNKLVNSFKDINELIECVSQIEVIVSLSIIGIDNEVYCIGQNSNSIEAYGMYHPLVKSCVDNDFTLSEGVVLTGSNMSGKTTFMRTIGINQILFNAGGIICAKEYKSSYLPIYTSLRANDMLSEGISTFYAEILRMKKMNEAITNGRCLILVDEIFKGTNAYERIEASLKVIDKFNEFKALFIISTHDFELCDAKNILNYHFNEHYIDDKIFFDYKIKEGKCNSSNALYLLKMSGII